jgi:NAD(P)-dependent dehydrogenase (short-subunit alcohol dehydrogenase family)
MRRQKWASSALLARELAPFGVTVNAVAPGAIRTRAHNGLGPEVIDRIKAGAPADFIAEPEDVAGCVAFWPAMTHATSPGKPCSSTVAGGCFERITNL